MARASRALSLYLFFIACAQLPVSGLAGVSAARRPDDGSSTDGTAGSSAADGTSRPSGRLTHRSLLAAPGRDLLSSVPPAPTAAHLQMHEWAKAERRAKRWRRTRTELDRFSRQCGWISEGYVQAVNLYSSVDRVVVFDVRHGAWQGLGDSISRLLNLLRLARSMGRAGFILSDPCADPLAPKRLATTPLSNGTTCEFDLAAYFRGFGPHMDFQWSERTRKRVEARHGKVVGSPSERVLSMHCAPGDGRPCELRDARSGKVVFSTPAAEHGGAPVSGKEMDWVRFLRDDPAVSAEPVLRIELTDMTDFFFLYERQEACALSGINLPPWWDKGTGGCFQNCEWFAFMRPKTVLWNALRPFLDRADRWDGLVAVSARTGFADHAHSFPDLRTVTKDVWGGLSADGLVKELEGMMQQCPNGTRKAWRELAPNAKPCVMWSLGIEEPIVVPTTQLAADTCSVSPLSKSYQADLKRAPLEPSTATGGPFGAYLDCAARQARALANGTDRWGVFVMSDAPALKCVAEGGPMGEHMLVTPTAWGHLQYAGGRLGHGQMRLRRLSLLAVADFYLLGICEHFMMMFTSAFPDQAVIRSKLASEEAMVGFSHAYEVWFWAGREAARGRDGADPRTLALLGASTSACPLQQQSKKLSRTRSSGGVRRRAGEKKADRQGIGDEGGGSSVPIAPSAGRRRGIGEEDDDEAASSDDDLPDDPGGGAAAEAARGGGGGAGGVVEQLLLLLISGEEQEESSTAA